MQKSEARKWFSWKRWTTRQMKKSFLHMIENHTKATGSLKGAEILKHFEEYLPKFKKIIPGDYKRMLHLSAQFEEQGMGKEAGTVLRPFM